MRWVACAPGEVHQRTGRRWSGSASGVDELLEAFEPAFLGYLHGAVAKQFLRHEERSRRARRGPALRRGSLVPGGVERGGLCAVAVVVAVAALIF